MADSVLKFTPIIQKTVKRNKHSFDVFLPAMEFFFDGVWDLVMIDCNKMRQCSLKINGVPPGEFFRLDLKLPFLSFTDQ
jgi:hypothetical protein